MARGDSARIARNSLLLYGRTIIIMVISLYTSRIVLNTLGVEDYGIYSVVGGVVSMLTVMSASLTAASQRFITFELGKKEGQELNRVFSTTVIIHAALGLLFLVAAETLGVWFLNTRLNIAQERMSAANWVFQGTMVVFIFNILSVPYKASVIAHERMTAFAYITILEATLKLGAAFAIQVLVFDTLASYGVLVAVGGAIVWVSFLLYSRKNFAECRFRYDINKDILKRMTGFAGWNFIGASSNVIRKQGINVLLNLFQGVILNAARGISLQVEHALMNFLNSFLTAIKPQITKSYAAGDRVYFLKLITTGARFSFYLLFILSLPILLETAFVLKLWLKTVPDYAVVFVKLTLIYILVESLSKTLITAMLATGRIRKYQIIVGGINLLNLPVSYVFLKMGFEPTIVYAVAILLSVAMLASRLILLKDMISLPVVDYLWNVVFKVILVGVVASLLPYLVLRIMEAGVLRFVFTVFFSLVSSTVVIYFGGLSNEEKNFAKRGVGKLFMNYSG